MSGRRIIWAGAAVVFISGFWLLAFTGRSDFYSLLRTFAILFGIYTIGWKQIQEKRVGIVIMIVLAVRLPFFFNLPQLSDDFYRFLWDGMLIWEGWNPFAVAPELVALNEMPNPERASLLLKEMNSPGYTSVYPPVHQAFFAVGHLFSQHSILAGVNAMRVGILFFEIALFFFALANGHQMRTLAAAYLLNPLVVAEGVGNLHLEAAMVPLLGVAIIMLWKGYTRWSGLAWISSALLKLTPLMLSPHIWWRLDWKGRRAFFLIPILGLAASAAWMWPVWSGLFTGHGLGVYFKTFEFNASIYYILSRGFEWIWGYNPIGFLGPALAAISFLLILLVSYKGRRSNPWEVFLLIYLAYSLLATTVHPWYVIPVVFFAIAAKRPLLLIWSFTAWFSYSHYQDPDGPKWIWIGVEYALLIAALIIETQRKSWLQVSTEEAALRG